MRTKTINIQPEIHRRLRVYSAEVSRPAGEVASDAIHRYLSTEQKPPDTEYRAGKRRRDKK